MKIALPSTNFDLGGAAIVTRRLTLALRDLGHDARMIVARRGDADSADPSVIAVDRLRWGAAFLAERAELKFRYGVRRKDLFKVSTGRYGVGLDRHPFIREADMVIVNWASQGLLSLGALERMTEEGKRIIYVMHDLWPATALCHLPGSCKGFATGPQPCSGCPYVRHAGKLISDITAAKRRVFSRDNIRLVAVSRWQKEQAMQSLLLQGKDIDVIPHPFPVEEFLPGEKPDPDGERLIVMAAARLDDPVKDLPTAVEALNIFAAEHPEEAAGVKAVFVGELRDPSLLSPLRIPYTHAGLLPPDRLRQLYGKASVVISSSLYETMGATLMEGMACGATPATFGDAGQRDIVDDGINGYIASAHTPASLAAAIHKALATPFPPAFLHTEVSRRFSPPVIASRYLTP